MNVSYMFLYRNMTCVPLHDMFRIPESATARFTIQFLKLPFQLPTPHTHWN